MEYVIHRLYLFHRRAGAPNFAHGEEGKLEKYAIARAEFIGGFIHSFVGNLAFLFITGSVLFHAASAEVETRQELVGVVLSSIAGNLVINILLVLGVATIIGGWLHKGVTYDVNNANAYAEMLTLAVIALGLPTLAYKLTLSVGFSGQVFRIGANEAAQLSEITAFALLVAFVGYFLYLVVGLRQSEITEEANARRTTRGRERRGRRALSPLRTSPLRTTPAGPVMESDAAETSATRRRSPFAVRGLPGAIAAVVIAGASIAWISEGMASALEAGLKEGFLPGISLNAFFVGFILLPLSSHVAEVLAAISMSTHVEKPAKGSGSTSGGEPPPEPHLETAQGITIGSSIQIALLVAPALLL